MPKEQADNTNVSKPLIIDPLSPQVINRALQIRLQESQNKDRMWDANKTKAYQNIQDFYNNNYWGYKGNTPTNYNPSTPEGQAAIQDSFNYAKSNVQNFATTLLTAGAGEGAAQAIKWATTPTKIGQGAEAVVSSAPLSTRVTKVTTIPRAEMHARNTVPGALKSRFIKTSNGLTTYTQPKVRILSREQLAKESQTIDRIMGNKGWRKITHPNLQGAGYTNGRLVATDIGPGNVGRDWLGRLRLTDFSLETMPQFRLAMQKRGGKLINNN